MANALASTRGGLQVTATDRAISWLPLYHDMGLVGFLLMPAVGADVDRPDAAPAPSCAARCCGWT